jgi:hypothetical protein
LRDDGSTGFVVMILSLWLWKQLGPLANLTTSVRLRTAPEPVQRSLVPASGPRSRLQAATRPLNSVRVNRSPIISAYESDIVHTVLDTESA